MSLNLRYFVANVLVALKAPFSAARRNSRQEKFIREMQIKGGERILDLGGTPQFWQEFPHNVKVTVVNLPSAYDPGDVPESENIRCIDGDACHMVGFADKSFDICFSNSVIEHVGGSERERAFAGEVRRLADRYWVQTPSIWFPIEAHTHIPFWWFLPDFIKRAFRRRWKRILPAWDEMIEGTVVILRADLQEMFPDADIWSEKFMLFTKSYVAYHK